MCESIRESFEINRIDMKFTLFNESFNKKSEKKRFSIFIDIQQMPIVMSNQSIVHRTFFSVFFSQIFFPSFFRIQFVIFSYLCRMMCDVSKFFFLLKKVYVGQIVYMLVHKFFMNLHEWIHNDRMLCIATG